MEHTILNDLVSRYPQLVACKEDVAKAFAVLSESYHNHGKLLICGNGGSAADAEHIVGELMQGALPAIALDGHPALSTAYMNDCEPLMCFAQQVNGYGCEGDVLLGISTSGNSQNILYAAVTAKAKGMKVIGLTGAKESKLSDMADVCICVPGTETYKIQELHLPVYHCLCLMLEEEFFGTNK